MSERDDTRPLGGEGAGGEGWGPGGEGWGPGGEDTGPIPAVPAPPPLLPPPPGPPAARLAAPPAPAAPAVPETSAPAAPPPQRQAPPPVAVPGPRVANPIAIASLVCGIVGLLTGIIPFTVPFGVVLSIVALTLAAIGISKGRRPNTSGTGVAIAGLITGFIGLVASCVWIAIALAAQGTVDDTPDLSEAIRQQAETMGPVRSVDDLRVGDCYNDPRGGQVDTVPIVSCAAPHAFEVFALPVLDAPQGAPFPGASELRREAIARCEGQAFTDYVGGNSFLSSLSVTPLWPTEQTWAQGDREVICAVSDPAGPRTGSLRNSAGGP